MNHPASFALVLRIHTGGAHGGVADCLDVEMGALPTKEYESKVRTSVAHVLA